MSHSTYYDEQVFSEAFGEPYLFLPSKVPPRPFSEA